MHIVDSGMACAINNINEHDWLSQASLFGHIIESYVVRQVKTQLAWQPSAVECYHFRDDKKREVDLVLEHCGKVLSSQLWFKPSSFCFALVNFSVTKRWDSVR